MRLSSLDLANTGLSDLAPLAELKELSYLMLRNNKLTDLNVLVEMAQKDTEKRFAPFWRIYLAGNPLSDAAKGAQVEELKKLGGKVNLE